MTDATGAAGEATAPLAARWLAAQQDVAARAAHELKNTLNGVAVNLEVVRSRLLRPGVQPDQVQRFAESAAAQLEALTRQVEALLALARAPHAPADVGLTAAQLLALRPRPESIAMPAARVAVTDADPSLVRLLLAAALARADSTIEVDAGTYGGRARVRHAGPIDAATRALAAQAGVSLHDEQHAEHEQEAGPGGAATLTLIFPSRGLAPAESAP